MKKISEIELNKWVKYTIVGTIIVVLALVSAYLVNVGIDIMINRGDRIPVDNSTPADGGEEIWPKEYSLSMAMVGDALIHGAIWFDARRPDGSFDFKPQLQYIKPIISEFDIAFYNAETVFGGPEFGWTSFPRFNTPSEFGDAMIDAGFNMVAQANNHTMDMGARGVENNLAWWGQQEGILRAGSYLSEEERITPKIVEKNNITYTLLAYTMLNNGLPNPRGREYMNNMFSKEKARADIERVRDLVDVLVVSIHWGAEYVHAPDAQQREIAQFFADMGVNILIGHHSHVLQPIGMIGDMIVYYSLGNFFSAQITDNQLTGVIASLRITKFVYQDGTSRIELGDFENELIWTAKRNRPFPNTRIIPFRDLNDHILPGFRRVHEQNAAFLRRFDDTIPVMGLE